MSNRVLVVDDEASIRNFLVRVLQLEGYEVQAASDGSEALMQLESAAYDLLLTDIKMDRLDGVGLLRVAKERYPDLAVILLTGHATVPSAIAALREGASDYLLKPAKNEDILSAVAAALENRTRQQRRDQLEIIAEQFIHVTQPDHRPAAPDARQYVYGGLELDTRAFQVRLGGESLDLTPTEFRLLLELVRVPGEVIGYVKLVQSACGYACSRHEAREIIGAHVINLRKKIGIEADSPLYVESVRGVGYRLVPVFEDTGV
ncbi:MAG: response regulator transcription factor [Anaerolineae bacterium]|nr:response regulator transcription factor [Anaerolineae bacterium]